MSSSTPEGPARISRERQMAILKALQDAGEQGLTKDELGKAVGGSTHGSGAAKAVERALQALRDAGAVILEDQDHKGDRKRKRFVLDRPPKWQVALTREARLALAVAELAMDQTGAELWVEHLRALEKVFKEAMGPAGGEAVRQCLARIQVRGTAGRGRQARQDVFRALVKVLSESQPKGLDLQYRHSGEAEATAVAVIPHALSFDAFAGGTYLLGWDLKQNRPWNFRVSRIESLKVNGQRALSADSREALKRAGDFQIGAWPHPDEPFLVRVRIRGAQWVRHFLETAPDLPEVQVHPKPSADHPTSVEVTFMANGVEGPDRWILQLGCAAEVLEPDFLRQAVAAKLAKALKAYETPITRRKKTG